MNTKKANCCSRGAQEIHFRLWKPDDAGWVFKGDVEESPIFFCPYCGKPLPATGWEEDRFLINICFDIDGVICEPVKPGGDYAKAKPYQHSIDIINELYKETNTSGKRIYYIRLQTARYMLREEGDQNEARKAGYDITLKWLHKHDVCFDELVFGKVSADVYVDDRGCKVDGGNGGKDWRDNFFPRLDRIKAAKRLAKSVY